MDAGDIVPSFTMGPVTPDFSASDLPEIATNAGDNTMVTVVRVENTKEDSLDLILSPSVKIQIISSKVYLR